MPEAGTSGNIETYDFNCSGWGAGSITATSGTAAVLANKGYTTIKGGWFTYASGPAIQINASDVRIEGNTVDGGDQGIILTATSERDRVVITGNTVQNVQGNGSSDGSAAGIYMLHTHASNRFEWDDLTISNNTLINNLQGGINLKCDYTASVCIFNRLTITGNAVLENDNTGIVVQDCYVSGAASCADVDSYLDGPADFVDLVVTDNTVLRQTTGGGIAIYGCVPSTGDYGKCQITGNESSYNAGVIGGIDVFNSSYITVANNRTDWNTTTVIDGNGILIDYGNRYVKVYGNRASNNVGKAGTDNSGVGIMCLKCEDVSIYSNFGSGNKAGMFFSGAAPFGESNISISHVTFIGNLDYGIYVDNSQADSITLKNSVLTGGGAVCLFAEASGTAQTEDYNALGCATRDNYDLANVNDWTDGAASFVSRVLLNAAGQPLVGSALLGAGDALGISADVNGDAFYTPPDIGAFNRTSCYLRAADGLKNPARMRTDVLTRCGGIPSRYPEGL